MDDLTLRTDIEWQLNNVMSSGQYSMIFLEQCYNLTKGRIVNTWKIIDELRALENFSPLIKSITKPASKFKKNHWLRGLWHKHFASECHIPRNLALHLENNPGWFEEIFSQVKDDPSIENSDKLSAIIHRTVFEGMEARHKNAKMTGEWIVFAKYESKNYYLTIASHGEDDCDIWDRCERCKSEFPNLPILRKSRNS